MISPSFNTSTWSAWRMVLRRCAITNDVRPCNSTSSACWMTRSVRVSTDDVASSRMRMRGSASAAARDREQLALPLAQARAALAQDGVIALGQATNEIVGARELGRGQHLVVARLRTTVADVVHDRIAEQERVLQDDANLRAERARADVAH